MREDQLEALEKLFPDGFLLIYPVDDKKAVRMHHWVPEDNEACRQIHRAKVIIECNKESLHE